MTPSRALLQNMTPSRALLQNMTPSRAAESGEASEQEAVAAGDMDEGDAGAGKEAGEAAAGDDAGEDGELHEEDLQRVVAEKRRQAPSAPLLGL